MRFRRVLAAACLTLTGATHCAFAQGGPVNDNCETALAIPCGGSVIVDNTTATGDPTDPVYPCTLWGPWHGAGTLWFTFQATATSADISLCHPRTLVLDTLLAVYSGDCSNLTQIACNDEGEGPECGPLGKQSRMSVNGLVPGQTYYLQVASWANDLLGQIELSILCPSAACPCPAGAIVEDEPDCGLPVDTVNGGCFFTPNLFTSIECGQSICATAGSTPALRDSDWYQVVTTNTTTLSFTVSAGFSGFFGLVQNNGIADCEGISVFSHYAELPGVCTPVTITAFDIPPGTWWWLVTPDWEADPCGSVDARYTVTLADSGCHLPMDDCDEAVMVECGSSVTFDNTLFTTEPSEPGFSCSNRLQRSRSAWLSFVASGTRATVSTCNPGTNSILDTVVAVYSGRCGALQEIACNDDDPMVQCGAWYHSIADVEGLTPGETYLVRVAMYFTFEAGVVELSIDCGEQPIDCNANDVDDALDIKSGFSRDCFSPAAKPGTAGGPDGIPDECQCVPDWNRDGTTNSTDVSDFINTFFADQSSGGLDGDINCDGTSNSTDVSDFINLWFAAQAGQLPFSGCAI